MEKEILRPAVTDLSLLPHMFEIFSSIHTKRKSNRYVVRKEFIFIAVWTFCPDGLIGGKLPNHFRAQLAAAMGIKSPQIISEEVKDLLFYYTTYSSFRAETNMKYSIVTGEMTHQES